MFITSWYYALAAILLAVAIYKYIEYKGFVCVFFYVEYKGLLFLPCRTVNCVLFAVVVIGDRVYTRPIKCDFEPRASKSPAVFNPEN